MRTYRLLNQNVRAAKGIAARRRSAWLLVILLLLASCSAPAAPETSAALQTQAATLEPLRPALTFTPNQPASTGSSTSLPLVLASPTIAPPEPTPIPPSPTPDLSIHFAVIGDYGAGGKPEARVAALVDSWQPDFIITTGDNNYPEGSADTIDAHIGAFYHSYIAPYHGNFGAGSEQNRFFPSLGNHDWMSQDAHPYLNYFELPGNERYYDFSWGAAHFFVLDSDWREPDGIRQSSTQAGWLEQSLANSTSTWNIVYFHTAPYSSGQHGSTEVMRWPFKDWGADAVLAGHDHTYERLTVNGIPYFVNGLGGGAIYSFRDILPESQARYNGGYGAMLVSASDQQMTFQFINLQGEVVDSYALEASR